MAATALLFDLDGTLWDSYPWYAENLAATRAITFADALERLRDGESIVAMLHACGLTPARFRRSAEPRLERLVLYEGVHVGLAALTGRGTAIAAVTNLPGWLATMMLDGAGLRAHFACVADASIRPGKPSARPVRVAIEGLGLPSPEGVFFVGDSGGDARAAVGAGVQFAWASYGYGRECPEGSAVVVDRFSDVLAL